VPEGVSAQEIQAMVSAPSQGLSFSAGYLGVLSNMMQQTLLDIGAAPAAVP
jgi:hypothetical protein